MDLSFTDEDCAFRREVRTWLRDNIPTDERPHDFEGARAWDMAWQRRQFDGGYGGIAWPREYGGQGLPLVRQLIWFEEYAKAGGPDIGCGFVGMNHGGPTLIARGSEDQKRRHLPKILEGDEVWCQGFSEPGAGSDLAGISTKGSVEGDELVVNGQKIWTSYAHMADFQELLVRTDPQSSRHRGLTWVICDMHSPGITVRPIVSMDGLAEFCEVFYDEVRIPLDNVVGEIGDGWSVAMSTLGFERGTGFMKLQTELSVALERLIEDAASLGALDDSGVRGRAWGPARRRAGDAGHDLCDGFLGSPNRCSRARRVDDQDLLRRPVAADPPHPHGGHRRPWSRPRRQIWLRHRRVLVLLRKHHGRRHI